MSHSQKIIVITAAVALSACSSGGMSSSSGGMMSQTPPPPAITTLASAPTGTAFTLAAHSEVEAFTSSSTAMAPIARAQFVANPSATLTVAANGITLTMANGDFAAFDMSANSTQLTAPNTYSAAFVGAGGANTVTLIAGPRLTYSTYGTWNELPTQGGFFTSSSGGVFSYGIQTTQMPVTGSATFTGTAVGRYYLGNAYGTFSAKAALVADFVKGAIAGDITNLVATGLGPGPGSLNDINLTGGTITGAGFSGVAAAGGTATNPFLDLTGGTGTFGGRFDGPNAAEADGTFALTYNRATYFAVAGAFAATGTATPAGQAAPPAPNSPVPSQTVSTLAAVPAGTNFSGFEYYQGAGLLFNSGPAFNGAQSGVITTTATGFTFQDGLGQTLAFDTTAGAADVLGPNHYFAQVQQKPYVGASGATTSYIQFQAAPLSYSSYGVWATVTNGVASAAPGLNPSTVSLGVLAYGVATPNSQVPISGSATYTGGFRGYFAGPNTLGAVTGGAVTLNADFGANTLNGSVTGLTTLTTSGVAGRMNDIVLASAKILADPQLNTMVLGTATAAAPTAATTVNISGGSAGNYSARFYGPGAAELAGVVSLNNGVTAMQGGFAAKK